MVFSAPLFLFLFLPIFFLFYYLFPQRFKNYILLIFSVLFYTWGAPEFIILFLVSIFADFVITRQMTMASDGKRRCWLLLSLFLNISLLAYFKYANFFVDNCTIFFSWLGIELPDWKRVVLPIGISFFTFQKISYTIDLYRKSCQPLQRIQDYAVYILMFPQLIAGPIVRFKEVEQQLLHRNEANAFDARVIGFIRFVVGLSKKVLIANVLGEQVDSIFSVSPNDFSTGTAWIGILAYTFQIYFDFSGYSDMALGLGKMMGFTFPENFNFPYISRSISEFWKRWHITLGKWMMDYLYIPLGGNRISRKRTYINLWLVFLISGLWHGDAWTFVAWGIFHGFFIVADKLFLLKFLNRIGKIPASIVTFFIVVMGWVIFRADSLQYAFLYFRKLFICEFRPDEFLFDSRFLFIFILAFIFSFMGLISKLETLPQRVFDENASIVRILLFFIIAILLYLLCGGAILSGSFNPFIYFRF